MKVRKLEQISDRLDFIKSTVMEDNENRLVITRVNRNMFAFMLTLACCLVVVGLSVIFSWLAVACTIIISLLALGSFTSHSLIAIDGTARIVEIHSKSWIPALAYHSVIRVKDDDMLHFTRDISLGPEQAVLFLEMVSRKRRIRIQTMSTGEASQLCKRIGDLLRISMKSC